MNFAGIYGRSSLGRDRQGETIEHQIEMIKEFAKRTNIDVIFDDRFIYEDDGESGFKTTLLQRPAMRRLLNDIDNGLITTVFFKGVSRFARDSGESITTAKRLKNKGVRVISLEENYDSDRDEPTMFQIYAVMAEQESRKTSIRVSLGNKSKARTGLWSGTICPFGYTKVKDVVYQELKSKLLAMGKHPQSLHPNENAPIVKRIFEMFVHEKLGRKKITNWLNTNNYKTTKGRNFQEKNIVDILRNEIYIGSIVYGKTRYEYVDNEDSTKKTQRTIHVPESDWIRTENAHPPIITKELFNKAQELLEVRGSQFNKGKRFNAAKHPLTGLLKCGKCSAPMICQKRSNTRKDGTKLEYRYYVCSTYHKHGRLMCDQANVRADDIEEATLTLLKGELSKLIKKWDVKNQTKAKNDNISNLDDEIKNLDIQINKKIGASKALLESREFYDTETFIQLNKEIQEEIKKLRNEKQSLEQELEKMENEKFVLDIDELKDNFKLAEGGMEELRKTFHKLLSEVEYKDKKITKLKMAYNL